MGGERGANYSILLQSLLLFTHSLNVLLEFVIFKIYLKKISNNTSRRMMGDNDFSMLKLPEQPVQMSPPKYPLGRVYTTEEIIGMFGFEGETAEWLRKREFDPDDPLIVLDYQLPAFSNVHQNNYNANRQVIINAMGQHRGQMLDHSGRVFFFQNRDLMDAAHSQMKRDPNTSWAFHPIHHDETALLAQLGPAYQPKILTFGIGSAAVNRFTVFKYQFFQKQ